MGKAGPDMCGKVFRVLEEDMPEVAKDWIYMTVSVLCDF